MTHAFHIDAYPSSPKRDARLRASWGLGENDLAVVYLGRVAAEKNLPLAIRAFDGFHRAVAPRVFQDPVGASGARIVLHTLHALHERQAKRGIASICIGGGLGGAMLVETLG